VQPCHGAVAAVSHVRRAGRLGTIELHDLYDDATLARIDRASRAGQRPPSGRGRAGLAAGAVAAAVVFGVREALDPPERVVIEELDPWAGGGGSGRVVFHWHPVPWESLAEVRW
jgi:hypothetical protein